MRTNYFDMESRNDNDSFEDYPVIVWIGIRPMPTAPRPGWVPVGPGYHRVLLTPACAVNHYGKKEISRIGHIMVNMENSLLVGTSRNFRIQKDYVRGKRN